VRVQYAGFALILIAASVEAQETAKALDRTSLSASVQKALALLEKTSPTFVKRGGCNSCHNQFLPAMAQALARERGIPAGKDIVQLPAAVAELGPQRAYELVTIGGANSMAYATMNRIAFKEAPTADTDAAVHYLQSAQEPDGRWRTLANRPPMTYDDFFTTAMSIKALQLYTPEAQAADAQIRIARAASWLLEATPQNTLERAFHLLGLKWTGASKSAMDKAVQGLLAAQGADGGWSQLPSMSSDAYATGQALYALNQGGGVRASDSRYRAGLQFLLRTQAADGSWHVKSRALPVQPYFDAGFPYGHDQWISAAGTSWAAMALTLAVERPKMTASSR
jgi:hypothetical protein